MRRLDIDKRFGGYTCTLYVVGEVSLDRTFTIAFYFVYVQLVEPSWSLFAVNRTIRQSLMVDSDQAIEEKLSGVLERLERCRDRCIVSPAVR